MSGLGLTQDQLAAMRADVAQLLPDTCIITANNRTSDGAGGWTDNWQPITGGTVACRCDPMPQRRFIEAYALREGMLNFYVVSLPYNAPVSADQRFLVNGMTLEVREIHEKKSWQTHIQVNVAQVV